MEKSDEIKKELESISPKLSEIPRVDAFKVQEEYFASLSDNVQQRIRNKQKPANVIRGHIFGPSTLRWVAASIAIIILGSGYYYMAWKSFDPGYNMSTEAYIIENFDEEIITEYISEIPVKTKKDKEIIDNSLDNIDEELFIEEF